MIIRLFEAEVRAACITGSAPLLSFMTHASNFSRPIRAAASPLRGTTSIPNCLKHSVNMLRTGSCRSTKAARAALFRVLGMAVTTDRRPLSISALLSVPKTIVRCARGVGKGAEDQSASPKYDYRGRAKGHSHCCKSQKTRNLRVRDLFTPAPEQQCSVGPAKAEGIRHGVLQGGLPRLVGNVVEVALWIGVFVIDRRRQHLVAKREHRDSRLQASCAPQQMAGHRFRGTDRKLVSVITKCPL